VRRESLSADARAQLLRVSLPELREYASSLDAAAASAASRSESGEVVEPLVEALDAALFRKNVSALHSWREWHCWVPPSALRSGCVARAWGARRAGKP